MLLLLSSGAPDKQRHRATEGRETYRGGDGGVWSEDDDKSRENKDEWGVQEREERCDSEREDLS